ncbi:MAG: hypothetical protein ACYCOU_06285 [Sulfobacillus sp.]
MSDTIATSLKLKAIAHMLANWPDIRRSTYMGGDPDGNCTLFFVDDNREQPMYVEATCMSLTFPRTGETLSGATVPLDLADPERLVPWEEVERACVGAGWVRYKSWNLYLPPARQN